MSTIKEIFLFLALVLLIAGAAGHRRVLSEQKKERELLYQQQEKFNTKVTELDKLLDGKINVSAISGDVPDEKLQEELVKHQEELAKRADIQTISFICLFTGLTIFAAWVLFYTVVCARAAFAYLKKFYTSASKHFRESNLNKLIRACLGKIKNISHRHSLSRQYLAKKKLHPLYLEKADEKIDTLCCDKKSPEAQMHTALAGGAAEFNTKLFNQLEQNIRKTILSGYHQHAESVQNSLKAQNETIEKQVAEVMQMAQVMQQVSAKNAEPVKSTLDELAKQVSAIREYTSLQHGRIEKLQEGYDWNIIKNFCLRVIRCIDNLETRIAKLYEQNKETADLEEIVDEFIFALESSGVEQFKPEINSDYNGQEKTAEVVKDKVCTKDPNMKGKIAEVLRPGYQYVIDDNSVKVVRASQVKLFG